MKNIITSFLFVLALSVSGIGQIQDLLKTSILVANELDNKKARGEIGSSEILKAEYDWLSQKTPVKYTYRMLYAGTSYNIVASASGDKITDIDLRAEIEINGTWIEVAKDNSFDQTALVSITPRTTAQYRFTISAYTFAKNQSLGYYAFFIVNTSSGATSEMMKGFMANLYLAISQVESPGNLVRMEIDILTYKIRKKSSYRYLYKGAKYNIFALASEHIQDLDLTTYQETNDSWKLLTNDDSEGQHAKATINTPTAAALCRFDVSVYNFAPGNGAGIYALMYYHQD